MSRGKGKKEQQGGVFRNSALIAGKTKKMALTYIGSAVCVAAATSVDSLVAGIILGSEALAAIAAAGPLLAIDQILHCLLGFGIDKLMIQAIGKGKRREADRIFGAVLIGVAAVYLLVYLLLLLLERPLLELILDDQALIDMMILYTRPLFITAPVFEVFLCIELAFRVDGRARLFSQRSIIMNLTNIIFDILLVSVLRMDLSGLAWSYVISTALGYTVSLSHFFSPKRTVTPDFSVIASGRELLSYIRTEIRLGSTVTLDELMDGLALGAQTAVIGVIGGTGGLAVWAVFKALRGIVLSVGNGVTASVSTHVGLLYSGKDYDGVRYSVKKGVRVAIAVTFGVSVLVFAFAGRLADLYHIESGVRALCAQSMRIGSIGFLPIALLSVASAYLPAVGRIKLTVTFMLIQKGLIIAASAISYYMSVKGFFELYVIALWLTLLLLLILLVRDRFWFVPERNPELIRAYSISLIPELISALSADSAEALESCALPPDFSARAALVLEDSMNYIARQNPDREICADIQIRSHENGVHIMIIDEGEAYNPLSGVAEADWEEPGALEAVIVLGLSAEVNYDRVLDLNHLSLDVDLPVQPII